MRNLLLALAIAGGTAAAAAPLPADVLARELRGLTAGPPISCVRLRDLQGPTIVDDHTLVYRQGRTRYVNTIPGGCPGLRRNLALVVRTPSTNLCSGDIATLIDPPLRIELGACALGAFTPWRKGPSQAR